MTNSTLKRMVRLRMAETGENYTTALRSVQALPPDERAVLNGRVRAMTTDEFRSYVAMRIQAAREQ